MGVALEPGFKWCFLLLKKRDTIIFLMKCCNVKYFKKAHKYGRPLLKLVDDALAIDRCYGSNLWVDAISKEMKNVIVAFNSLEDDRTVPHGFQFVKCHMMFDIKMEDFHHIAHLVAGGHTINIPAMYPYASVIRHETISIALVLAALNLLEVMAADILKTYTTSPCKKVMGHPWFWVQKRQRQRQSSLLELSTASSLLANPSGSTLLIVCALWATSPASLTLTYGTKSVPRKETTETLNPIICTC